MTRTNKKNTHYHLTFDIPNQPTIDICQSSTSNAWLLDYSVSFFILRKIKLTIHHCSSSTIPPISLLNAANEWCLMLIILFAWSPLLSRKRLSWPPISPDFYFSPIIVIDINFLITQSPLQLGKWLNIPPLVVWLLKLSFVHHLMFANDQHLMSISY